ncbi:MAG: hypothetical protein F6K17_32950, partial [Okeania sp. SIO3C4]|nr:hypothetical protein [Okeania sp. SIO3C4]
MKNNRRCSNSVYNINLNYLGVNPPLTPPRRGSQSKRVRREERRKNSNSNEKVFCLAGAQRTLTLWTSKVQHSAEKPVSGTEFY